MKKIIVLICAIVLCMGCASISFNPDTGNVEYTRIGDQHIKGFELEKTGDGDIRITLDGQQSNADALTEAIKVINVLSIK